MQPIKNQEINFCINQTQQIYLRKKKEKTIQYIYQAMKGIQS